jgi:hypothetical protein|tara:strand:+ start:150 stop:362 length:213 start_codon:yes stop_codon:yes gene_type:complete
MITEQDIIFDEISNEVYLYLEDFREYIEIDIEDTFQVNKSLAKKLLDTWIENHDTRNDKNVKEWKQNDKK